MRLLVLGAGYVGAKLAELALGEGHDVVLADNWHATRREQVNALEARGARVETVDVREPDAVRALLETPFDRVHLLAAQASRPLSISDPEYTEQTNLAGPRVVAEALAERGSGAPVVFASSLHVYGPDLRGEVTAERPYGPQGDLAHLSKIYAELCLELYARRNGFDLALLRLGIVYGPSPVEHERPESQTVVDKFRRLVAAGEEPVLDAGGERDDRRRPRGGRRADPARRSGRAGRSPRRTWPPRRSRCATWRGSPAAKRASDEPAWTVDSPFDVPARRARATWRGIVKLLVTGASGFLGSRVTLHLREHGHEVVAVTRPGPRQRSALAEVAPEQLDAGGPEVRELIAGCAAVLHFGGVPDPGGARRDPARAVRENAGTTLNLLEGCAEHGAGLVYPSSVRAAVEPPPDPYALSKRLGEEACRLHPAPGDRAAADLGVRPGPARARGRDGRDRGVRVARARGRADRDPGRSAPHTRLRVRRRLRRRGRAARTRERAGTRR